ncbi:partial Carboxylesterase NlhH, partial [Anaerolineales bacterium]
EDMRFVLKLGGMALIAALILSSFGMAIPSHAQEDNYQVHRNLVYASLSKRNVLDLYIPLDHEGPFPLVVWVHGGGWESGSKNNPPEFQGVLAGYALASLSYRLTDEASFPAQIHDVKAAIRWLRANAAAYNIDPEHIGVWGGSAGGHLVSMLGTTGGIPEMEDLSMGNPDQSSQVQAVVDWYGPSEISTLDEPTEGCRSFNMDRPGSVVYKLLGCPPGSCPDKAAAASPITYVTPDDPPFLIQQGQRDCSVPYTQSQKLAKALEAVGVSVQLTLFPKAGHGGRDFREMSNMLLIKAFFDEHLIEQP